MAHCQQTKSLGSLKSFFLLTSCFKNQIIMAVVDLVGSFDDIVRSSSVLAEGIEGGQFLWQWIFGDLFFCTTFVFKFKYREKILTDFRIISDLSRIFKVCGTSRRVQKEMVTGGERGPKTAARNSQKQGANKTVLTPVLESNFRYHGLVSFY